jgi:hypothetical protein
MIASGHVPNGDIASLMEINKNEKEIKNKIPYEDTSALKK